MGDKYEKIITVICEYNGINKEELVKLLKNRDCKYLLFLFLKKYKCVDFEKLRHDFSINSKGSVTYNYKRAREKFFINKEFREKYFQMEELIKNKKI